MQSLSWLSDDFSLQPTGANVPRFAAMSFLAGWQRGYFGPLPTGESITVVVDYFSRFAAGAIYKSTIQAKIIEAIFPIFARFGVL